MSELTHLDAAGRAQMVDVAGKEVTQRRARARATVRMSPATAEAVRRGNTPKGDVIATARTGVEMEALCAAGVAALTLYDMVKGIERGVFVERIELLSKSGGRSGEWTAAAGSADTPPR